MDKEIIKKIIEAGNLAPSGGNSQPWKFIARDNTVEVAMLPEKDHPILNFKNRGTYVAHGALMENVEIAASSFGYKSLFEIFPRPGISARITFQPLERAQNEELKEAIAKRHSNRKPYKNEALLEEEKRYLFEGAHKFPQCELAVAEGEKMRRISENLAFDLVLFLSNKLLHEHFFQEVLWEEEDQKLRGGLYIKTMEIAGPKAFIFKLLKNWTAVQLLNRMKLPQKIYKESVKTASSAGLFGAIIIRNQDDNFIYAGRLMENIWLRATKLNLGFQLITGVPFLWQQLNFGKSKIFSKKDKAVINKAYRNLLDIFRVEDQDRVIACIFRIGEAEKPLAISYKRPPSIDWK